MGIPTVNLYKKFGFQVDALIQESTLWWKEFWIMKEYGVRESWTWISLANSIQALQPLCSTKGSDFILSVLDEKFVLIDPKDGKKYEDFMIDGFRENVRKYYAEVYAESLISPK